MRTPRLAALLVLAAAVATHGAQGPSSSRSWPPGLQRIAPDSPVLSPADEMKTFFMAPGYRVELVASEPMIQDPIVIDWDPDGRLWAIEMPGYMPDIRATGELEPTGRIVVLEDVDDDGAMDKRTVFADGLVLPRALKVLDRGVLVGEPPNLWLMRDANGDLKADGRELVTDRFGRREANVEHNANSLMWALDNWMYTSEVDIYLRLKNGAFEVRRTLSRGQWGATQDDAGRVYRNTNSAVLFVDIVPTPYYTRHPNLLRTRGSYESLLGDDNETNTVWPVRPTPGVNRGYQTGILRADGSLAEYTAVGSPVVYRGDRLPADAYGNVFVAEPSGNLVSRIIVEDDGSGLQSRKAYPKAEFLASTDERFRPVYLSNAPDGTLYLVDIYRGIIQHRGYITEYLRDQIVSRKLEQPTGLGRIYRVMHGTTRRDNKPTLSSASAAELVRTLSHPNGWRRDAAQRLLVERGDKTVVSELASLAERAPDARTRLHALWTLDGLDGLTPELVGKALDDRSRDVRVSALRLAERWLADGHPQLQPAVVRRMEDQDWNVRRQLAATIGTFVPAARVPAAAMLLDRYANDPVVLDAAISGLQGHELGVIEKLASDPAPTPMREAAMAMLAGTVIRGGKDEAIATVLEWSSDTRRPEWQRSALLRGAEIALLGAAMPGAAPPRPAQPAAAAPCPTCPGARGGPGGAPAFPAQNAPAAGASAAPAAGARGGPAGGRGGNAGPGRGAGAGGPRVRLAAEPVAFVALAATSGDLGTRAARVLSRVDWPGKPGAAIAVQTPALSQAEELRVQAGEEIYRNLCQACHLPDGTGQERLGANLVESPLVTASPQVVIRILLHGKEGKVGLMPPLGAVLNDDQVAASLSYIRRQWGRTGSVIDPAAVKEIRAATTTRARPWTDAELAEIK